MIAEPTPMAQMMPALRPNAMLSRTTLAKSAPGAIAASTNTPNSARNSGARKLVRLMLTGSQIQHHPRGVFKTLLDADQERHRLLAVDHAVIVGQRKIHHRPDLDLAGDCHRSLLDLVHAEDARLRRIQDRRRHQRAVDTAVRDREGATLHLVDLELAVAGTATEVGDALLDVGDRFMIAVSHHWNDETSVGADGDADVIVILVDQIGAIDLGIDGGDVLQGLQTGLGEESHEAEF